jgi:small subunit ribosomal protein S20
MPITKSAAKRMRSDKKKHERRKKVLSLLKSKFKKFSTCVTAKNLDDARKEALLLVKESDKAASKGIIPKKRADRKKSRLALALNKLAAANSK